jgi:hypothetical protein
LEVYGMHIQQNCDIWMSLKDCRYVTEEGLSVEDLPKNEVY